MTGETEKEVSGWTVDTLRAHIQFQIEDLRGMLQERYDTQTKAVDAAFKAAEGAVQAALASAEKAVTKAEVAAEKRFEATNEFRGQLSDQAATFLPRAEADVRIAAGDEKFISQSERIGRIENIVATIQGRMIAYAGIGAIVGSVATAFITQTIN